MTVRVIQDRGSDDGGGAADVEFEPRPDRAQSGRQRLEVMPALVIQSRLEQSLIRRQPVPHRLTVTIDQDHLRHPDGLEIRQLLGRLIPRRAYRCGQL